MLRPKKLLLLDELIKQVGYGDTSLVEDICKGMGITGEGPPMRDKEDLWRGAKSAQQEKIPMRMSGKPRSRRCRVAGGSSECGAGPRQSRACMDSKPEIRDSAGQQSSKHR